MRTISKEHEILPGDRGITKQTNIKKACELLVKNIKYYQEIVASPSRQILRKHAND